MEEDIAHLSLFLASTSPAHTCTHMHATQTHNSATLMYFKCSFPLRHRTYLPPKLGRLTLLLKNLSFKLTYFLKEKTKETTFIWPYFTIQECFPETTPPPQNSQFSHEQPVCPSWTPFSGLCASTCPWLVSCPPGPSPLVPYTHKKFDTSSMLPLWARRNGLENKNWPREHVAQTNRGLGSHPIPTSL